MKIYKLDKEEKDFLKSVHRGEYKISAHNEKEKEKYVDSAKKFFKKDVRINIRINKNDLERLKKKAMHEGLPYQSLIGSVLHKYAAK